MDGIEECGRSGNPEVIAAAVECVVSLLDALEKLCSGTVEYISPEVASLILGHWPNLHDADYTGPLTYQTLARLPSPYRYVIIALVLLNIHISPEIASLILSNWPEKMLATIPVRHLIFFFVFF